MSTFGAIQHNVFAGWTEEDAIEEGLGIITQEGNVYSEIQEISGNLLTDLNPGFYRVTDNLVIPENVNITIAGGVVLEFAEGFQTP